MAADIIDFEQRANKIYGEQITDGIGQIADTVILSCFVEDYDLEEARQALLDACIKPWDGKDMIFGRILLSSVLNIIGIKGYKEEAEELRNKLAFFVYDRTGENEGLAREQKEANGFKEGEVKVKIPQREDIKKIIEKYNKEHPNAIEDLKVGERTYDSKHMPSEEELNRAHEIVTEILDGDDVINLTTKTVQERFEMIRSFALALLVSAKNDVESVCAMPSANTVDVRIVRKDVMFGGRQIEMVSTLFGIADYATVTRTDDCVLFTFIAR